MVDWVSSTILASLGAHVDLLLVPLLLVPVAALVEHHFATEHPIDENEISQH
jgi:hypothetical protein